MFCSRCGKTIYSGDEKCRHCGQPIGASRFMGTAEVAAYTAAQNVEEAPPVERDDREFTRTSYMTDAQAESRAQDEGDVMRQTVYRPVLRESEAEGRTNRDTFPEPEQEPAQEAEETVRQDPREAPAQDEENAQGAEEKPAVRKPRTPVEIKPVKLAGISPQVMAHMSDLEESIRKANERAARKGGGVKLPNFGRRAITPGDEEEAEGEKKKFSFASLKNRFPAFARQENPYEDEDEEDDEAQREEIERAAAFSVSQDGEESEGESSEDGEEEEEPSRLSAFAKDAFGKLAAMDKGRLTKIAGIALAVILVLALGSLWLGRIAADKSKIPGVTTSVYKNGIAILEKNDTDDYFEEIRSLYFSNFAGVTNRFNNDLSEITALLPANPQENDAAYINTVYTLQQSLQNTATEYALSTAEGAAASMADSYRADRARVENAIGALKTATSADQLSAITQAAQVSVTTDTGNGSDDEVDIDAGSQYIKLTKGMMNSNEVYQMQERLIELGYLAGEADGSFGSKTELAVKRFQKRAGFETDGIATPEVQAALYAADAPSNPNASAPASTPAPAAPQGGDAEETPAPAEG